MLGPKILFDDFGDKIEGRWVEPVFKVGWEEELEFAKWYLSVVPVDSNLDEMRCLKQLDKDTDIEWRLGSSRIDSTKVSIEEECNDFEHTGRHSSGELMTLVKVES